jgi:opacity protein-like surface antigen
MKKFLLCAIAVAALSAPAFANEAVLAVYRAGVAAQKCDVTLSGENSSLLADVISRAEQASGLSAGDLEALWNKIVVAADADQAGFCAANASKIEKVIASAQ